MKNRPKKNWSRRDVQEWFRKLDSFNVVEPFVCERKQGCQPERKFFENVKPKPKGRTTKSTRQSLGNGPMFRSLHWLIIFAATSAHWFQLQSQEPSLQKSGLLIEVVDVMGGVGGVHKHLWLRVMKDGTFAWEENQANGQNTAKSSKLAVSQITRLVLRSVDSHPFRGRMGPYNIYIDSGVELQFRVMTETGERRFSVVNPWPGHPLKPIPPDLKIMICELESVRSQADGTRPSKWCTPRSEIRDESDSVVNNGSKAVQ